MDSSLQPAVCACVCVYVHTPNIYIHTGTDISHEDKGENNKTYTEMIREAKHKHQNNE